MKQKLKAMESLQQKMLEHSRAKTSDKLFTDDKEHFDSSDAEGIIDKLNASTTKILNEIQQIQYKMQPQVDFQERQKQFIEKRNKKINDLRQLKEKSNQEHYKQKPKINPANQMINKYMEKSLNGKNGDLLKKQDKDIQVGNSAKMKGVKYIFSEAINEYENDDQDGIAIQTSPIEEQIEDKQFEHHHSKSLYIPIHQRTNYIIQQKNEKMAEIKQQKEQVYEEWIQSLPFKPQLGDCSKQVLTQEEADLFAENQIKWRQQADDWLFQQQINKLNQTPQYTHRPQISRRSTKESTKQSISFHENSNKYTSTNSNLKINQTERKQKNIQKSPVQQFKFKTEERSTIKKAKEQQELFMYS